MVPDGRDCWCKQSQRMDSAFFLCSVSIAALQTLTTLLSTFLCLTLRDKKRNWAQMELRIDQTSSSGSLSIWENWGTESFLTQKRCCWVMLPLNVEYFEFFSVHFDIHLGLILASIPSFVFFSFLLLYFFSHSKQASFTLNTRPCNTHTLWSWCIMWNIYFVVSCFIICSSSWKMVNCGGKIAEDLYSSRSEVKIQCILLKHYSES